MSGTLGGMRELRPYLPGGVFHVTARTLNKDHWFEPVEIREYALSALVESLKRTDANLITFAIMTNHLHLVVRQGGMPLAQLMQPFLRRIARRVQGRYKRSGRIFGKRYWAEACTDAEYFRRLILYTNINPLRAKYCDWECDYNWSSHSAYLGAACNKTALRSELEARLSPVLSVFASGKDRTQEELHADYRTHVAAERMRLAAVAPALVPPRTDDGDEFWSNEFAHRVQEYGRHPRPAVSVHDIARAVLKKSAPGLPIDWLLTMRGGRQIVAVRHEIVERSLQHGHRPTAIATYLRVAPSTVSRVRSAMIANTFVRFTPFPKVLT